MIACWLACSVALVPACNSKVPSVTIGRVVLDAPRSYDAAPTQREALRNKVTAFLQDDGSVTLKEGEKDATHVLHIRVGETLLGVDPHGSAGVPVQVRLRPIGKQPLFETVGRGKSLDAVVGPFEGFTDAWQVLLRLRELEGADPTSLLEALKDNDARLRDYAIVRLGERKEKGAVKPLCELLLKEERPELILRAIGSLVAIGESGAVEPLIELSSRKDPDFVLQIVFAVGSIGGRTAEAYLVTMASGHPVEAVRRGAEQALAELSRRPPSAPSEPQRR